MGKIMRNAEFYQKFTAIPFVIKIDKKLANLLTTSYLFFAPGKGVVSKVRGDNVNKDHIPYEVDSFE